MSVAPVATALLLLGGVFFGPEAQCQAAAAAPSYCDDEGAGGFRTVFQDEFDGEQLDESKWNVEVAPAPGALSRRPASKQRARVRADCSGRGCIQLGSCRDAACVRSAAYLEEGALTLRSSRTGSTNFTTGAVNTWGKAGWRASAGAFRVCVSARLPGVGSDGSSQGLWPAHWLMPHDDTCDPDEGEMDIMEMVDGNGEKTAVQFPPQTFLLLTPSLAVVRFFVKT
jgi:beta-glucanase (GH16 family)